MFENSATSRGVLVTGTSGLVGSSLVASGLFPRMAGMARTKPEWWPADLAFFAADVWDPKTDWAATLTGRQAVIFLAFPTNIDQVEKFDRKEMDWVTTGYARFCEMTRKLGVPVMFVSSDAVLWGLQPQDRFPGCESKPINKYGALKAQCEQLTIAGTPAPGTCVVRCTPIGFHPHNPTHGLVSSVVANASTKRVMGYSNSFINPVDTHTFARFAEKWVESVAMRGTHDPIIHLGSSNSISKYDVLAKILAHRGLTESIEAVEYKPSQSPPLRVTNQTFLVSRDALVPEFSADFVTDSILRI